MMEERKRILKMIEEGKITAEEGLALLDTIEAAERDGRDSEASEEPKKSQESKTEFNNEQFQRMKEELHDATEKIITSANKGATKLFEMISKGIQKIQEIDFDFDLSLGNGIKVIEVLELENFKSKNLHLQTSNGSIRCKSWEKEYAYIEVSAQVSKVKDEAEAREKLVQSIFQKEEEGNFYFQVKDAKGMRVSLTVYLPQWAYEQLRIETNNGSVQLGGVESEEVHITSSNGSIRINHIEAHSLFGETSNGRIQYHDVEVEKSLLKTSNGSVHIEGEVTEVECQTTNGSIRIQQKRLENSHLTAKTSNGSIRIYYPLEIEGVYGELETGYGSLKADLTNARILEEESQISKKRLRFQQGENQKHYISALSNTGSIYLSHEREYEE